jgi:hypothetical protein
MHATYATILAEMIYAIKAKGTRQSILLREIEKVSVEYLGANSMGVEIHVLGECLD